MGDTINRNVTAVTNFQSDEDVSEYTDADESISSAPTEYFAEFLSAIMTKDYKTAMKYCHLILQYEPHNSTAKEFYPLIKEKLQLESILFESEQSKKVKSDNGSSTTDSGSSNRGFKTGFNTEGSDNSSSLVDNELSSRKSLSSSHETSSELPSKSHLSAKSSLSSKNRMPSRNSSKSVQSTRSESKKSFTTIKTAKRNAFQEINDSSSDDSSSDISEEDDENCSLGESTSSTGSDDSEIEDISLKRKIKLSKNSFSRGSKYSDATTGSYSSLEDDEIEQNADIFVDNDVDNENGNSKIVSSTSNSLGKSNSVKSRNLSKNTLNSQRSVRTPNIVASRKSKKFSSKASIVSQELIDELRARVTHS